MDPSKKRSLTNYLYTFLIGFLLCLLVQFYLQDKFESKFFENVSRNILIKRTSSNGDSDIVDALHVTYRLLSGRTAAFKETSNFNFDVYSSSLSDDLLTAKGACASYAKVLGNLLNTMGYETRIIQMKVNGLYGGHIITEVSTKKGWVVLDAMYDLFFITPAGTLASFKDVSANWSYYKDQTPKNYNKDYKYEDVRYTNWEKIPFLMPALKKIMVLLIGETRTDAISIRPLFLRKYRFFCILLIPLIVFFVVRLRNNINPPRRPRQILFMPQRPSRDITSATGLARLFNFTRRHSRSRQRYFNSFIAEVDLQSLLECHDNNGLNAHKTAVAISVFNIPFNSKTQAMKLKLGGAAYNVKSHSGEILHDIYFYTLHLYDKRAIAQFHYFDKKYFLCNITFTDADQSEKNSILDIIAHKYSVRTDTNEKQILADREGNLLMLDNSVNLNISYINNNSDIIRQLLNQQNPMARNKSSNFHLSNLTLQKIL